MQLHRLATIIAKTPGFSGDTTHRAAFLQLALADTPRGDVVLRGINLEGALTTAAQAVVVGLQRAGSYAPGHCYLKDFIDFLIGETYDVPTQRELQAMVAELQTALDSLPTPEPAVFPTQVPNPDLQKEKNTMPDETPSVVPQTKTPDRAAARRALAGFLESAFTSNDLKRLVHFNSPFDTIINSISWDNPLGRVVQDMIAALEERDLIGPEFFEILKAERPRRASEIERVITAYGGQSASSDSTSGSSQSATSSVSTVSPTATPQFTRSTVYKVLMGMAPEDFNTLVTIFIAEDARQAVRGLSGHSTIAQALINHYDVPYRGLAQLAECIREVVPDVI